MYTDIEYEVRRCWNAGMDKEEMVSNIMKRFEIMKDKMVWMSDKEQAQSQFTPEGICRRYDHIEKMTGGRSLNIHELHGGTLGTKLKTDTSGWSEEYKRWKGVSGPGAQLKEIVKQQREKAL